MAQDLVIANLGKAMVALRGAKTAQEVKKIMDVANAAEVYAKRQKLGDEAVGYAHAIKMEALRRLGEFLAAAPKRAGARGASGGGTRGSKKEPRVGDEVESLEEMLGVPGAEGKKLSFVAQRIAALPEEQFASLRDRKATVGRVMHAAKRAAVVEKLGNLAKMHVAEPTGEYDVIVIDPPWPLVTDIPYPVMSIADIEAMTMPAADDCHLWLWTVHNYLRESFDIVSAWGFEYACCFVWHKPTGRHPTDYPGYNCEFALYARRGKPTFVDTKDFETCFEAPVRKHSEKPEEFYEVLRRVTAGRRLDMFNRRKIEGFDGWGNQSPKKAARGASAKPRPRVR